MEAYESTGKLIEAQRAITGTIPSVRQGDNEGEVVTDDNEASNIAEDIIDTLED